MGKISLFDLENHFAFYGSYHSNKINIFIHMIFVWPIFFTALVLPYFGPSAYYLSQFGIFPSGYVYGFDLNLGFLVALIYGLYYLSLDKKAGSLGALLCLLCWIGANSLAKQLGFSLAWKFVLAAQVICWCGQFLGHAVFEKRAPALLDNLTQAFVMAPFFVLLEALNILIGYEPYPGFHVNVNSKIAAEIKEWKDKGKKIC